MYIIAVITKLIEFCDHHHFSNSRMLPSSLREKLYLLVATSLSPILQSPSNHWFIFCLNIFVYSGHYVNTEPCYMWVLWLLLHLACFQSSSTLPHVPVLCSFLWLQNVPLWLQTWKESYDKPRHTLKNRNLTSLHRQSSVQSKLWFFQ